IRPLRSRYLARRRSLLREHLDRPWDSPLAAVLGTHACHRLPDSSNLVAVQRPTRSGSWFGDRQYRMFGHAPGRSGYADHPVPAEAAVTPDHPNRPDSGTVLHTRPLPRITQTHNGLNRRYVPKRVGRGERDSRRPRLNWVRADRGFPAEETRGDPSRFAVRTGGEAPATTSRLEPVHRIDHRRI